MRTSPVVHINPDRISRAAMASAAQILLRGGLVAYPTETVYGLGANALDREAVRQVFRIKKRPRDKPLIVLVRHRRQMRALVQEITPAAKLLMERFWPDGLTLVLEASAQVPQEVLGGGSAIALRISGHRVARALLDAVGVPLTSSSANLSGHPPPVSADQVQRHLGGRVGLILDGGVAAGAMVSTILDVRDEPVRLLREGRLSLTEIRRVVPVERAPEEKPREQSTVLLLCTGNTCRSAMAQGLLETMLSAQGIGGFRILSAGTQAQEGERAARWAAQVAIEEDGIDLAGHRARSLTRQLLERADLILTMTLSHARQVEKMSPVYARKTYLLTSFPGTAHGPADDIDDPMGGSPETYRRVYERIKRELERILPILAQGRDHWHR